MVLFNGEERVGVGLVVTCELTVMPIRINNYGRRVGGGEAYIVASVKRGSKCCHAGC